MTAHKELDNVMCDGKVHLACISIPFYSNFTSVCVQIRDINVENRIRKFEILSNSFVYIALRSKFFHVMKRKSILKDKLLRVFKYTFYCKSREQKKKRKKKPTKSRTIRNKSLKTAISNLAFEESLILAQKYTVMIPSATSE